MKTYNSLQVIAESITVKVSHEMFTKPWNHRNRGPRSLPGLRRHCTRERPSRLSYVSSLFNSPRSYLQGGASTSSLQPSFLLSSHCTVWVLTLPLPPTQRHLSDYTSSALSPFPFQWGHSHQYPTLHGFSILK